MGPSSIDPARIAVRREEGAPVGEYVLYWMQQSQRATWNHALEHAVETANALGLPVLVTFAVVPSFPGANARHYQFMLEGLRQTELDLAGRGISLVVRRGEPVDVVAGLARAAAVLVMDRGYLPVQRRWRQEVVAATSCRVVEVESDAIIPVEAASDHVESAARTLRPKIRRLYDRFARPLAPVAVAIRSDHWTLDREGLRDPARLVGGLGLDESVAAVPGCVGGGANAERLLEAFMASGLPGYGGEIPDLCGRCASRLAPYLHFGQISPLRVALRVQECADWLRPSAAAFLEQLAVRRELALNYAHFMPSVGRYEDLPEWARATLAAHAADRRDPVYSEERLEAAETDDPYWNAAMDEMRLTGYLHNHLRMYWAKQILFWSDTPERAFAIVSRLNDRYFLDGRDPNSLASVAWAFGQHDRPWPERRIFGKVRSMTRGGLERKADTAAYLAQVALFRARQ